MIKYLLIFLGILDLLSFIQTIDLAWQNINNLSDLPVIQILAVLLIVSLLASGVLSILMKKSSLIIYYSQFLFKMAFFILTFGFVLNFIGFQNDTIFYKIIATVIMMLELGRLIYTIYVHRKYFTVKPPAANMPA
jgi:hypothetical protein